MNVMNVIVVSLRVTCPSSSSSAKTPSVRKTIHAAEVMARIRSALVRTESSAFLGLARKMASSTGSTPSDCAGGPSITMLIQRICIALSGFGSPKMVAMVSMVNAAKDVDSWNERKLRML